jgi:hypothetical protein
MARTEVEIKTARYSRIFIVILSAKGRISGV